MNELLLRNQQKLEVIDKPEHQAATLGLQGVVVDPDDTGTFLFQYNGLQCVPGMLRVTIE